MNNIDVLKQANRFDSFLKINNNNNMLPIESNMFSTCNSLSNFPLTSYYENMNNYKNAYRGYRNQYNLYHGNLNLSDSCKELNNTIVLSEKQKNKVKETIIEKYNNYNNKVDKFTDNFSSNELELLNMLSEEDKILFKNAKQLELKYNKEIEKDNITNGNKLSTLNIFISVFIAATLISLVSLHTVSIIIFTTLSIPLFIFTKKIRLKLKRKELIKLLELYD